MRTSYMVEEYVDKFLAVVGRIGINEQYISEEEQWGRRKMTEYLELDGCVEALTFFELDPGQLAEILFEAGAHSPGGFGEIEFLEDMRLLYVGLVATSDGPPLDDKGEMRKANEVNLNGPELIKFVQNREISNWEDMTRDHEAIPKLDVFAPFIDGGFKGNYRWSQIIPGDEALGVLIHLRYADALIKYVVRTPGGDDDYFDYYPGLMAYWGTIFSWFMDNGPRMV